MDRAIIYTRVSTDDQAEKGFSLRDQKDRLEKYCKANNIEIIKHYEDDGYSAKTFNRPQFTDLLTYIRKNKNLVNKLLVVKWDRFSRNTEASFAMISQLVKLGVNVEAIEQRLDDKVPENLIMKALYLAIPEVENLRRSKNTKDAMRKALMEGRYVSTAPYGYKNERDELKQPIIVPSPMAEPIRKSFEMIDSGLWQVEPLRKKLYGEGLKISRSNFYTVLKNPIYCGKIRVKATNEEAEQIIQGIHQPLISEELFYRVQDILQGKKKSKRKYSTLNNEYPLRGHLTCSCCGRILTGSSAKGNGGKYYYYHCVKGCKERYKSDHLNDAFNKWLDEIELNPNLANAYLQVIGSVFKLNEGDRTSEIKKVEKALEDIDTLIANTDIKFAKDTINADDYNRMITNFKKEKIRLNSNLAELKSTETGFDEYCKYGINILSDLRKYYSTASLENKQRIIGLIFPHKIVFEKNNFQTIGENEILDLLCNADKGFGQKKTGLLTKKSQKSCVVTPTELFSNQLLERFKKLYELRHYIPINK